MLTFMLLKGSISHIFHLLYFIIILIFFFLHLSLWEIIRVVWSTTSYTTLKLHGFDFSLVFHQLRDSVLYFGEALIELAIRFIWVHALDPTALVAYLDLLADEI